MRQGIHACRTNDLAYWLNQELWEIELDGSIQESHRKIVSLRGRLLQRLDARAQAALPASFPAVARGAAATMQSRCSPTSTS